jgi:hypothetical protein
MGQSDQLPTQRSYLVISLVDVAKRTARLEQLIQSQAEQIELLKTQIEDIKAKPNGEKRKYERKRNPSQD